MVRLKVYDGQEKIHDLELGAETASIGRDATSTIVLPDVSVSRRHAQVEPNGNFYLIRDNGSTNGTFVNEMLVRVQLLSHGDTIRVGRYVLRVESQSRQRQDSTRVRVDPLYFPGQSAAASSSASQPTTAVRFEETDSLRATSAATVLRLCEIQGELAHLNTAQEVLAQALAMILTELRAERGAVLLEEKRAERKGKPRFAPAVVLGGSSPAAADDPPMVVPEPLVLQVFEKGRGVRWTASGGPRNRHALIVPLRDRMAVNGVVYVERPPARGAFSQEDLQLLLAIASAASASYSNARLLAEVSAERSKLHAVFASLTDGVLVTDRQLRVVDANRAATLLLGCENTNPLGASLIDLFGRFRTTPDAEAIRAAAPRHGTVIHLSSREAHGGTGVRGHLAGRMLPYPAGSGDPQGVVVWLRDESEVEHLEAVKTQFLANLAHKLRSPLTVVQACLPLLRESPSDARQILDDVERNARVLCSMVEQFTDYAELEARAAKELVPPAPLKLKPLLREAVKALEGAAAARGVLIVERAPESLPLVAARQQHLLKAFQQILDNAVKFVADRGHVVIEAEDLGGCVRVDFIDDGPGIPKHQVESVFLVGHQVDAEHTGQVPGAGIGLAMARHLIQEHGGDVAITSPYRLADRGTRVSVVLPVSVAAGVERIEEPVMAGGRSA